MMKPMGQDLQEWLQLLGRWLHITTAVTWIGSSIFFMWLDRSFRFNPDSKRAGHVGDLWMIHGGGFYHVEKLQMGPVKVPPKLHWFKWEAYWTWMSGMLLLVSIFYTGGGSFLLDASVSSITYPEAVLLGLFSVFGSWLVYDSIWESSLIKNATWVGHLLTMAWLAGMSYLLCHVLSGRAAYIHIGAMLGTWMTANVFMRIIPRQVKMVEAVERGEGVNPDWSKNAKNRSTHNTYFTLPVIFIMLSNHFPSTYGHDLNWLILLLMSAAGAAIREFFVKREQHALRAKAFGFVGVALITGLMVFSKPNAVAHSETPPTKVAAAGPAPVVVNSAPVAAAVTFPLSGVARFEGVAPERQKLSLPSGCTQTGETLNNDVLIHDGRLQNVLVRVTAGHEALARGTVPATPVEVDQRGCLYSPRVVGVRVGQDVAFINSDAIFHNVRSLSKENPSFNLAMPRQDQREVKRFEKPELFLQTKCSVHPWMSAYIAVMDHPYFAVSDAQGNFTIPGLPAGTYTLEFWHEVFGKQSQSVTIGPQGPEALAVTFKK